MPPQVERARLLTRFYGEVVLEVAREALARARPSRPQLFVLDTSEDFAKALASSFAPPEKRIAEREVEKGLLIAALGFEDAVVLCSTPWKDFPHTALRDFADGMTETPAALLEEMCLITAARGGLLLQHLSLAAVARGMPS